MGTCLHIADEMAIWKKPASGDVFAPYDYPEQHLDEIYFHSKFDYYAEAATATVPVSHPAYSASTGTVVFDDGLHLSTVTIYATKHVTSRVLLTHNLGYVPKFLIADEDYNELPAAVPIQYYQSLDGGARFVRHYATTTQIVQVETAIPGLAAMSSLSKTYRVVVFRDPDPVAGKPLFEATLSNIIAGHGKLDASEKHLRLALTGETAFKLPTEPVFDVANGQVHYERSGGFWIESVSVKGASVVRYNGSFPGADYLSVVA